jgi:hypothetical protein
MPDPTALTMPTPTNQTVITTLGRAEPALSATSDMPVIAAPQGDPPPAEPTPLHTMPEPAPAPEPAATPEPAAEPPVPETPAAAAAREDRGVGKKLNTLEAELAAERAARADEARRAADLQRQLNEALIKRTEPAPEPKPEPAKADVKPPRPRARDFATPEEHEAALDAHEEAVAAWTARQAEVRAQHVVAADKLIDKQQQNMTQAERDFARIEQGYVERVTAAKTKYEDFEQVAHSGAVPITGSMALMIKQSEHGPDVAYFLGKNPDQAKTIAEMTTGEVFPGSHPWAGQPVPDLVRQAAAIGRIEGRFQATTPAVSAKAEPAPKQISKAPEPIAPLGNRNAAAEKDLNDMTPEEYAIARGYAAKLEAARRQSGTPTPTTRGNVH